jgi:nicotinate-nucleotide pyrophosphorylase (carboxylating)
MQVTDWLRQQVSTALNEDIGSGDLSAKLIVAQQTATATVICRENAIMCGQTWFNEVFSQLDDQVRIEWLVQEGEQLTANTILCRLHGRAPSLLTGERTSLNFLQSLMGTATAAHRYATELAAHGSTKLLDTRKTLPGLRLAQKYAVRIGGGVNHRIGLFDAILIKENHIIAAGSLANAVHKAKESFPNTFIEAEVESLAELETALNLPLDRIMLDNFTLADIHQAVSMTQGKIPLEVSGNVTFDRLAAIAETGVDFISTGAITKHLYAIDLSMRFEWETNHA